MNVKERIHLKQKIAVKLGMDAHSPAIEVAKRYMESQPKKILADDMFFSDKKKSLDLIEAIYKRESILKWA